MTALQLAVQYASASPAPSRARVRRWVAGTLAAVPGIDAATLTLRFVDDDEGRTLNRTFRGKDHATNVLTFPLDRRPARVDADIVVCLPVVAREAHAQGKTNDDHCAHLVVHGTLHACGYDHEDEAQADAMEALERAVLRRFRIADPYAVERSSG